jgi:hypothetical protein
VAKINILKQLMDETSKEEVRKKAARLLQVAKKPQPRSDGKRSCGGMGDKVFVKVQRGDAKSP